MEYRITFDRIGRDHNLVADFDETEPDDLAHAVHRFARGHLGSSDFSVVVDLMRRRVFIEDGRFGSGTIEVVPA